MKQKYYLIFGVIAVLGIIFVSGCIKEQTPEDARGEIALAPEYPEEYLIYQDYIKTIGNEPRISDVGTVEVTIISITNSEACPYQEEKCRIEPYPKDIGVVRIDKIISYNSYSEQTTEQPLEQPGGEEPSGEVKTTPGYKGEDIPSPKSHEYEQLQVGQEVPITFLLTARPVKVIYASILPEGEPEEPPSGLESAQEEPGQTAVHRPGTEPMPKTYKPIPKQGYYFIFTTKIIEYPKTSQKTLPGLKVGDKFKSEIRYDGTLYVGEYEVIP